MSKPTVLDIFLKDKLSRILTDIKELNAKKIDRDIELIWDGVDYNEIFNNQPKEIELELANKVQELNMLIICAKKGFDYFYNEELPKYKKYLSEEEYNATVKQFEEIIALKDIEFKESEEAN